MEKCVDAFNNTCVNLPSISLALGIHGDNNTVIGTVGEAQRMEAAIVSIVTSIATSLQRLTKQLKSKILISKSCYEKHSNSLIQV